MPNHRHPQPARLFARLACQSSLQATLYYTAQTRGRFSIRPLVSFFPPTLSVALTVALAAQVAVSCLEILCLASGVSALFSDGRRVTIQEYQAERILIAMAFVARYATRRRVAVIGVVRVRLHLCGRSTVPGQRGMAAVGLAAR